MEQITHSFIVDVQQSSGLPAGKYYLKEANHRRLEFAKINILLSIKKIGSKVKIKAQSCSDAYQLPTKEIDAVSLAMGCYTGCVVLQSDDRLITVEVLNGEVLSFN